MQCNAYRVCVVQFNAKSPTLTFLMACHHLCKCALSLFFYPWELFVTYDFFPGDRESNSDSDLLHFNCRTKIYTSRVVGEYAEMKKGQ